MKFALPTLIALFTALPAFALELLKPPLLRYPKTLQLRLSPLGLMPISQVTLQSRVTLWQWMITCTPDLYRSQSKSIHRLRLSPFLYGEIPGKTITSV
jgi:hypothetical protein